MRAYNLSSAARSDLKEISAYTLKEWGHQALDKYLEGFEKIFESIRLGKVAKRTFSKNFPRLFYAKSGRHFVFYIDDDPFEIPTILAILHEKMDIANRLEQRMDQIRKSEN